MSFPFLSPSGTTTIKCDRPSDPRCPSPPILDPFVPRVGVPSLQYLLLWSLLFLWLVFGALFPVIFVVAVRMGMKVKAEIIFRLYLFFTNGWDDLIKGIRAE